MGIGGLIGKGIGGPIGIGGLIGKGIGGPIGIGGGQGFIGDGIQGPAIPIGLFAAIFAILRWLAICFFIKDMGIGIGGKGILRCILTSGCP